MTKTLTALAAAATMAAVAIGAPTQANAQRWVVPGIIGGLAAGAIIGSAAANPYYYGPGYGPGYYQPGYGGCYWTRGEPVWDGYRWVRPRIQVCN
ncbi:MAG: hypothetical protein ACLPKB_32950 [Xanthobacteraceae bacterium]